MSDQESISPSKLSKNPSSDIRLYERVRLQSYQNLLHGSLRSPGKHPRVLLEDLLKAEVLSSQLVLAIEGLAKSLQRMLDTGQESGEDYGMSSTTEDESIRSFRSALAQSANTLDELTKLRISEHGACKEEKTIDVQHHGNGSLLVNAAPILENEGIVDQDESSNQRGPRQTLSFGSDSTTPSGDKSSSFSARESTSPSDITAYEEEDIGGAGNKDDAARVQDAVKTLRDEIHELQVEHEVQFMTFATKCMELEPEDNHNMRRILERIIQKMSPQDQNWTFHGRLTEAEMEQLFYFVLLQKTLKSCVAVIDNTKLMDTQLCDNNEVNNNERKVPMPALSNESELCAQCRRKKNSPEVSMNTNEHCQNYGNVTTLDIPKNEPTNYYSSDSNEEPIAAANGSCLSNSNGKRPRDTDFEDEHKSKKRKKGKHLFACFSTRWARKNKRNKK